MTPLISSAVKDAHQQISLWLLLWQILDWITRGALSYGCLFFVLEPESAPVALLGSDKSAFTRVASVVSPQPTG